MALVRQVSLIPAGCQPWNLNVIASSGSRFAYAATLAIYIYDLNPSSNQFYLHSIMSEHKKTITSIAWHPRDHELLISCSSDSRLCIWHVAQRHLVASLNTLPLIPNLVACYPEEPDCVVYTDGKSPLCIWRYSQKEGATDSTLPLLKKWGGASTSITQISWHKSVSGFLALGHADGTISLYCKGQKPRCHVRPVSCYEKEKDDEAEIPISALQWDPLSPNYLLMSSMTGLLQLVDTSTDPVRIVTKFTTPSKAVTTKCISWISEAPGVFVTGDSKCIMSHWMTTLTKDIDEGYNAYTYFLSKFDHKFHLVVCTGINNETGVLRIWTVSKERPLENMRLKQTGFQALCVLPPNNSLKTSESHKTFTGNGKMKFSSRVVCLFLDGGVGVYNLKYTSWDFFREMGHLETIFDCQFKPDDCDLLATASFDGTIKIWNVNTVEAVSSSPGDETIIYSLSWAPADLNCIAAATSKSGIFIWNVSKGCITKRIKDHGNGIYVYCVAWNQTDARKIASAGADGTCMVHHIDGKLQHTFKHPATVYGCDWNPNNENILATACEDGNVRIFYEGSGTTQPLKILSGHTSKVFRVKWSPLKDGLLCSTSDDCTVRVWDYASGSAVRVLEGHTNHSRGLLWSPELPNIVISGSWDYTIRVWDVSDGACINIIEDHGGDVYGLACHPQRPFFFASTSRDSTVRLWSMLPLISTVYLKMLANRPWEEVFSPSVNQKSTSQDYLGLYGTQSKKVKEAMIKYKDRYHLKSLRLMTTFFCPPTGVTNLWDLVAISKGEKADYCTFQNGIVHRNDVIKVTAAKAREKELVKMTRFGAGGIGAPSKEECLRTAAEFYLLTGNLRKYCEIKVELEEWHEALVVAPGVSVEYWFELADRWNKILMDNNDPFVVPMSVATNNIRQVLEFYKKQNRVDQAYLVSVAASEGAMSHANNKNNQDNKNDKTEMDRDGNYNKLVMENIKCLSERYLLSGCPVLAACCFLAVDDIQESLYTLLRGHELELAICIALSLNDRTSSMLAAVKYLAWRCTMKGEWEMALDILDLCPGTENQKAQICAHCGLSLSERNRLHEKAGFPPVEACLEEAEKIAANNGPELEAVQYYLLSEDPRTGLNQGLKYVAESLMKPSWNLESIWQMLQALGAVRSRILQENYCDRHRFELQVYSAYIGALIAMRQGYYPVVVPLLNTATRLLRQVHNVTLAINEAVVNSEMQAWVAMQIDSKQSVSEEHREYYRDMQLKVFEEDPYGDVGVTVVGGSHLPRHSDQHRCYLRGTAIQGPVFFLEDYKSAISLNDALMWAKVNPFSPLGSGLRINPF